MISLIFAPSFLFIDIAMLPYALTLTVHVLKNQKVVNVYGVKFHANIKCASECLIVEPDTLAVLMVLWHPV